MKELFVMSVLDRMSKVLPPDVLMKLNKTLDVELANYNIMSASKEVVPYAGVPDQIRLFLVSKKLRGCARGTLENYDKRLHHFYSIVQKPLEKVEATDIRKYLAMYSMSGVKLSTIANAMTPLQSFYTWMVDNGYLDRSPMKLVPPVKVPKTQPKPLSDEEMELLRIACRDNRDRALLEVYYSTACRLSELINVNITDIDWREGTLTVMGKGSVEGKVFITDKAMVYLKKYIQKRKGQNTALFTTERAPFERMGVKSIQDVFRRLGKTAKLTKKVHPHKMRTTRATNLLQSGAQLSEVQGILRHSSPDVTLRYAQHTTTALHNISRKFA